MGFDASSPFSGSAGEDAQFENGALAASAAEAASDRADYITAVRAGSHDPLRLETLFRAAQRAGESSAFAAAIATTSQTAPENVLLTAWRYRLQPDGEASLALPGQLRPARLLDLGDAWGVAIPLSLALALLFWLLSDPRLVLMGGVPVLAFLWSPLTALALIGLLTGAVRQHIRRAILVAGGLVAITAFSLTAALFWTPASLRETYSTLMLLHLPVLAWAAVGLTVLGWRPSSSDAFAFLLKSLETLGVIGVAVIAGGLFVGLTYGMFSALSIDLPDVIVRLLVAG